MHVTVLPRPILRFAVHETGAWELLSPWFPVVVFPAALLAVADGRRLRLEGDMLYLRCTNGEAAYRLEPEEAGARRGRLAWSLG